MKILFILFFSVSSFSYASSVEDSLFDQNHITPIELLKDAYEQKDVLLFGTSNHLNYRHYERILELLESVGSDPDLKYIVLERSQEISGFYELLSTHDLTSSLEKFKFRSAQAQRDSLCDSPEWSYTINVFLPKIREINRRRHPLPPIIVKGLEDMPSETVRAPAPEILDGSCKVNSININGIDAFSLWGISNNREQQTALNFENEIWNDKKSNEKVIVIAHYMHLLNGFSACRPVKNAEGVWKTEIVPLSWINEFINHHPEAQDKFSLVINDEADHYFIRGVDRGYNPQGGLKISSRQSLRYPDQSFAFKTSTFKGVTSDYGSENFLTSATINTGMNGQHFSNQTIDELAFGIIWNGDADKKYALLKTGDYLPEMCSGK